MSTGVSLILCASVVGSIGDHLGRVRSLRKERHPEESSCCLAQISLWVVGVLFALVEAVCVVISLTLTSVVILVPLSALSTVWTSLLSKYFLKETLNRLHARGCLLIILGSPFVSLYGSYDIPIQSLNDLFSLYGRRPFYAYYMTMYVFVCICIVISLLPGKDNSQYKGFTTVPAADHDHVEIELDCDVSPTSDDHNDDSNAQDVELKQSNPLELQPVEEEPVVAVAVTVGENLRKFCLASVTGILSGFTTVLVQNVLVILSSDRQLPFTHWTFYFVIFLLASITCAQLYFLSQGIKEYTASYMVPVSHVIHIASSCMTALALYPTMFNQPVWHVTLYIMGVTLIISGILVVKQADKVPLDEDQVNGSTVSIRSIEILA